MHPGSSHTWGIMQSYPISWVLEVQQEYGWGVGYCVSPLSVLTVTPAVYRIRSKETLTWGEVSGLCGFKEQPIEGLLGHSAHCHDESSVKNDLGQAQLPSVFP